MLQRRFAARLQKKCFADYETSPDFPAARGVSRYGLNYQLWLNSSFKGPCEPDLKVHYVTFQPVLIRKIRAWRSHLIATHIDVLLRLLDLFLTTTLVCIAAFSRCGTSRWAVLFLFSPRQKSKILAHFVKHVTFVFGARQKLVSALEKKTLFDISRALTLFFCAFV